MTSTDTPGVTDSPFLQGVSSVLGKLQYRKQVKDLRPPPDTHWHLDDELKALEAAALREGVKPKHGIPLRRDTGRRTKTQSKMERRQPWQQPQVSAEQVCPERRQHVIGRAEQQVCPGLQEAWVTSLRRAQPSMPAASEAQAEAEVDAARKPGRPRTVGRAELKAAYHDKAKVKPSRLHEKLEAARKQAEKLRRPSSPPKGEASPWSPTVQRPFTMHTEQRVPWVQPVPEFKQRQQRTSKQVMETAAAKRPYPQEPARCLVQGPLPAGITCQDMVEQLAEFLHIPTHRISVQLQRRGARLTMICLQLVHSEAHRALGRLRALLAGIDSEHPPEQPLASLLAGSLLRGPFPVPDVSLAHPWVIRNFPDKYETCASGGCISSLEFEVCIKGRGSEVCRVEGLRLALYPKEGTTMCPAGHMLESHVSDNCCDCARCGKTQEVGAKVFCCRKTSQGRTCSYDLCAACRALPPQEPGLEGAGIFLQRPAGTCMLPFWFYLSMDGIWCGPFNHVDGRGHRGTGANCFQVGTSSVDQEKTITLEVVPLTAAPADLPPQREQRADYAIACRTGDMATQCLTDLRSCATQCEVEVAHVPLMQDIGTGTAALPTEGSAIQYEREPRPNFPLMQDTDTAAAVLPPEGHPTQREMEPGSQLAVMQDAFQPSDLEQKTVPQTHSRRSSKQMSRRSSLGDIGTPLESSCIDSMGSESFSELTQLQIHYDGEDMSLEEGSPLPPPAAEPPPETTAESEKFEDAVDANAEKGGPRLKRSNMKMTDELEVAIAESEKLTGPVADDADKLPTLRRSNALETEELDEAITKSEKLAGSADVNAGSGVPSLQRSKTLENAALDDAITESDKLVGSAPVLTRSKTLENEALDEATKSAAEPLTEPAIELALEQTRVRAIEMVATEPPRESTESAAEPVTNPATELVMEQTSAPASEPVTKQTREPVLSKASSEATESAVELAAVAISPAAEPAVEATSSAAEAAADPDQAEESREFASPRSSASSSPSRDLEDGAGGSSPRTAASEQSSQSRNVDAAGSDPRSVASETSAHDEVQASAPRSPEVTEREVQNGPEILPPPSMPESSWAVRQEESRRASEASHESFAASDDDYTMRAHAFLADKMYDTDSVVSSADLS